MATLKNGDAFSLKELPSDLTAQVPQAMAAALRDGNLGVMDYYRMENLQSDTDMRRNLLGGDGATPPAAPQA